MNLSPSDFKIRSAHEADVDKIVRLVESVYRGSSSKQGWTTEADLLDGQRTDAHMIREMMNTPNNFFYVISADDKTLAASVHLKKEVGSGYIGMLAVDTRFQNRKLGKKLLLFCEEQILLWGLNRATMTVLHLREELLAWYERFGYVPTGRSLDFPTDPRYGIPKVSELRLLELEKVLTKDREK